MTDLSDYVPTPVAKEVDKVRVYSNLTSKSSLFNIDQRSRAVLIGTFDGKVRSDCLLC